MSLPELIKYIWQIHPHVCLHYISFATDLITNECTSEFYSLAVINIHENGPKAKEPHCKCSSMLLPIYCIIHLDLLSSHIFSAPWQPQGPYHLQEQAFMRIFTFMYTHITRLPQLNNVVTLEV